MGTNYYVTVNECSAACEHCTSEPRTTHLGKSSMGWQFMFRANHGWTPENAFNEWVKVASSGTITDEYKRVLSLGDLLLLVHEKLSSPAHGYNEVVHGMGGFFDVNGNAYGTVEFT